MSPRAAIFVFHDVVPARLLPDVPASHRPYVVTPEELRAFLLAAEGAPRHTVIASDVPSELGGAFYSLTFDDGRASDYTEVFPALVERGLRATFFVVPSLVGTPGHVTWVWLREMVAAGMEVGSHSLTHPFLHRLDATGLRREYGESKVIIEDQLGAAVRAASLPRGWEPAGLRPILEELSYRVFCTSRVGWWHPGDPPLAMPRVAVRRGIETEEFVSILAAEPGALWRLQALDMMKTAVKTCVGFEGWQRLRAPLLALRRGAGGKP